MNKWEFGLLAGLVLLWSGSAFGQTPPVNDNFTNATVLIGSALTFTGTLAGATLESAETNGPFPGGSLTSGGSVWWSWTASESTAVIISVLRDYSSVNFTNASIYVYAGNNLSALTLLDANGFYDPPGRYVAF